MNVTATKTVPHVFTISYQDFEDTLTPAFMDRVSDEIAGLAARGTTVTTGSGDWGVGCTADGVFRGDFPSSSPYVVSVGATTFTGAQSTVQPGAEVGIHFSSGGFSTHFARPRYQDKAVSAFLSTCAADKTCPPAPGPLYNNSGRGFPDVAAVGWNLEYVINGKVGHVGGTSASSPVFAATLSLVNSARLAAGKPTLGWANPLLYSIGGTVSSGAFRDVVQGANGCGGAYGGCEGAVSADVGCVGFNATAGWDPMTGFGTPVFPKLAAAAAAPPAR
eukprot:SAG22_NODE_64_length_23238_cov_83.185566_2_plen_276_part_00